MPETQKTMLDPAWADLWPAPLPGRPVERAAPGGARGPPRRRLARAVARDAVPALPGACPVCRPSDVARRARCCRGTRPPKAT